MPKYFFEQSKPLTIGDEIILEGDTAFHLTNVLRVRQGEKLILCNGDNTDYATAITSVAKNIFCIVENILPCTTEPKHRVTLYQAMPKGDKMDLIIQKAVELGVHEICPVITSRSLIKIKDGEKKAERYNRIAESAAGQSMRGIIPKVHKPINLKDAAANNLTFVAYEEEQAFSLKTALQSFDSYEISIWIGPEGGFTPEEILSLQKQGAAPVSLGKRILRTETAAIAAIAQILCFLED